MGPRIDKEERRSQATPLAEDVLAQLQGQLAAGAFGSGVGPLQREAGTAIRQYLASLFSRQSGEGLEAFRARGEAATERSAAELREGFGAFGSRFGSQVQRGETDLRREALLDQAALEEQQRNIIDQLIAGAIPQMFAQGQANIQPFLQLAAMGILPEEIIASPGVGQQLLGGALAAGGAFLGGPAGAALLAGGGNIAGQGPTSVNSAQNVVPSGFDPSNIFSGVGIGMQPSSMPVMPTFNVNPNLFAGNPGFGMQAQPQFNVPFIFQSP